MALASVSDLPGLVALVVAGCWMGWVSLRANRRYEERNR